MPARADEFSPAFSGAFDDPGPANQFTTAFAAAFDPPAIGGPVDFTIRGRHLAGVGNWGADAPYLLHVVDPDGVSLALNTITGGSRTRVEFTWAFARPGTHYFVVVDAADDTEVSARLPVVVTT